MKEIKMHKVGVKAYNGDGAATSSSGGVEIELVISLEGTTVTFFLTLFLFAFGGAGGGASDSYTYSLQVFSMRPSCLYLLHFVVLFPDPLLQLLYTFSPLVSQLPF
jgi:hypothetical protein